MTSILAAVLGKLPVGAAPDNGDCLALRARQWTRISHRLMPLTGSVPPNLDDPRKAPRKTDLNRVAKIRRKPAWNLTISTFCESLRLIAMSPYMPILDRGCGMTGKNSLLSNLFH